ncbi:MAG: MBL fold metallo-hydrolase [Firmicutes bacterium]|nr:MBL fold metallo-hydrolase [Bacillota bacterium]
MIIETIKVGSLETNCYLVINNNKCIIVDPGDDKDKIISKIDSLNLTPIAIFITHYHFDHIGALNDIKNKYNIKVYDYNDYEDDNKLYNIDNFNFKIIETKGHKEDLVTFYFPNENIMFVGDFIFKGNIGRCDLDGGNFNKMIESIKKIKKYPKDTIIYPGHGESTTLNYETKYNIYFNI